MQFLKMNFIYLFAAILALTFVSCEQDNEIELIENFTDDGSLDLMARSSHDRAGHKRCFRIVFPVTLEFPDGSTALVDSQDALISTLKDWKENNPDAGARPHIVFPYDVTLPNGDVRTVEDLDELHELLRACGRAGHDRGRCFKLVFPVTVEFPDGSGASADSRDELKTLYQNWADNNPDSAERPSIGFPYDVELKNGDVATINDTDELAELMATCDRRPRGNDRCFKLVFPITLDITTDVSQNLVTVDSKEALRDALESYIDTSNPITFQGDIHMFIVTPYEVTLQDGSATTVNDLDDLQAIIADCSN